MPCTVARSQHVVSIPDLNKDFGKNPYLTKNTKTRSCFYDSHKKKAKLHGGEGTCALAVFVKVVTFSFLLVCAQVVDNVFTFTDNDHLLTRAIYTACVIGGTDLPHLKGCAIPSVNCDTTPLAATTSHHVERTYSFRHFRDKAMYAVQHYQQNSLLSISLSLTPSSAANA